MPENDELQRLLGRYSELTPLEQETVRQRVIANAQVLRAELLRALFGRLVAWIKRRQAIAQLQAFDDRDLKDMGITRGEIESAVRGCDRGRGTAAGFPRRAAC